MQGERPPQIFLKALNCMRYGHSSSWHKALFANKKMTLADKVARLDKSLYFLSISENIWYFYHFLQHGIVQVLGESLNRARVVTPKIGLANEQND